MLALHETMISLNDIKVKIALGIAREAGYGLELSGPARLLSP
jgi:hypothetical protein